MEFLHGLPPKNSVASISNQRLMMIHYKHYQYTEKTVSGYEETSIFLVFEIKTEVICRM